MRKTGKGVMVYDGRWVSSSRDATWCHVTLCGAVSGDSVSCHASHTKEISPS